MALAEGTPGSPGGGSFPVPLVLDGKTEPVTPSGDDDKPALPVVVWPAGPVKLPVPGGQDAADA